MCLPSHHRTSPNTPRHPRPPKTDSRYLRCDSLPAWNPHLLSPPRPFTTIHIQRVVSVGRDRETGEVRLRFRDREGRAVELRLEPREFETLSQGVVGLAEAMAG